MPYLASRTACGSRRRLICAGQVGHRAGEMEEGPSRPRAHRKPPTDTPGARLPACRGPWGRAHGHKHPGGGRPAHSVPRTQAALCAAVWGGAQCRSPAGPPWAGPRACPCILHQAEAEAQGQGGGLPRAAVRAGQGVVLRPPTSVSQSGPHTVRREEQTFTLEASSSYTPSY